MMKSDPTARERRCRHKAAFLREMSKHTGGIYRSLARELAALWDEAAERVQQKQSESK
jgi:hypothetical protein